MLSSPVAVFDLNQDQGCLKQVIERVARSLEQRGSLMAVSKPLKAHNASILRKEIGLSLPGREKEEYLYVEQDSVRRDCIL